MLKASGADSTGSRPGAPPAGRVRPGPWFGWAAGLLTLVLLTIAASWRRCPYLLDGFTGQVVFPAGIAGRVEPLLCTGRYTAADFLVLNFIDEKTATFSYDSWGVGGPVSPPFTFEPGVRYTLHVEMPGLAGLTPVLPKEIRPLRVRLDGREILAAGVRFHPRAPHHIYFAENPVGGNTAWSVFRGRLATAGGQRLLGGHRALFRWPARLGWWLKTAWWEAIAVALAGAAAGLFARRFVAWAAAHGPASFAPRVFVARGQSPHAWFVATALACTALFAALVTTGTFRFVFAEEYGDFYDHQAASLLQGRLDVPEAAIGGEAFVVGGRMYGYFGVTPAVLRLPFVAAGVAFGQLSRVYLTGYYVASLFAGYLLLCHATRRITAGWPSPAAVVLFTLAGGPGSTLFFLGARAYIYHEAILCGAAFTLWSVYFSLRYLAAPASRVWAAALVCGVFAIQARPSSGLFALCVLGVAAVWIASRHRSARDAGSRPAGRLRSWREALRGRAVRRPLLIGALAAAGILSFNGMSYLKFRTFDGSPFRYSVQYTEERRAKFEGRNFHLANLPHNFDTYVLHPAFLLRPRFPYLFIFEEERSASPGARIDLEEPALAFPYAMPALFVLAVLGGGWAAWWAPPLRPALGVLVVAVIPMSLALFTAVVTSHRFTGDFCPFFIACAACGIAVWDAESRRWRRGFLALAGLLTAISILVTLAIALRFQGEVVWGVPDEGKRNYEQLRRAVDGLFGTSQGTKGPRDE